MVVTSSSLHPLSLAAEGVCLPEWTVKVDGAFSSNVALVPYQWLDLGDGVRVRFTAASG